MAAADYIPALFPFPIRQVPTWAVINADDPLSLPLMGQFNTDVAFGGGKPIWAIRPGIAGGQAWMQYVGEHPVELVFTFHGIANDILDFYPQVGWSRLKELAERDDTLGRPPRVWFVHGLTIFEGYITSFGDPSFKYWQHDNLVTQRSVREVGPVQVTITIVPGTEIEFAIGTAYILHTGNELVYEEIAKAKYGSAMFGAALRDYNQGVVEGGQVEAPRRENPELVKISSVSPYFDTSDAIEGL
jgi:hypothetical protein